VAPREYPCRISSGDRGPRRAIVRLRRSEELGDDAFHQPEEQLDRAEFGAPG